MRMFSGAVCYSSLWTSVCVEWSDELNRVVDLPSEQVHTRVGCTPSPLGKAEVLAVEHGISAG